MLRFLSILLLTAAYCSSFSLKNDPTWQCNAICTGSGGKAEFSDGICKCLLNKGMDGTDVVLMQKKAELLGLVVEVIEPPNKIKRETNGTEGIEIADGTAADKLEAKAEKLATEIVKLEAKSEQLEDKPLKLEGDKPKEDSDKNEVSAEAALVGQKPPSKLKQLVAQIRNREPPQATPEQQFYYLQQITEHLNRLGDAKDERTRQHEMEIIRGFLRRLPPTLGNRTASNTPPLVPQTKTRMSAPSAERIRTIVRNAKEKRLKLNPKVGAAVDSTVTKQDTSDKHEEQAAIKEIFHRKKPTHFQVITEDPKLIDE